MDRKKFKVMSMYELQFVCLSLCLIEDFVANDWDVIYSLYTSISNEEGDLDTQHT